MTSNIQYTLRPTGSYVIMVCVIKPLLKKKKAEVGQPTFISSLEKKAEVA